MVELAKGSSYGASECQTKKTLANDLSKEDRVYRVNVL